jgi:hypothetical protein
MMGPDRYSLTILNAIQFKPMYLGTSDAETVRRRRAKNKIARKSRRSNRASK